jgi:hypothetical protein
MRLHDEALAEVSAVHPRATGDQDVRSAHAFLYDDDRIMTVTLHAFPAGGGPDTMSRMPANSLEILSVGLLERHRDLVEEMRSLSRGLAIGLGWHYLLDLAWIIDRVGAVDGRRILDAGAGVGILQWYLARHGAEVLSVD